MRKNKINRCIEAVTYRLGYYFKNTSNSTFMKIVASKGKCFLFGFFIYLLVKEVHAYLKYFLKKPNIPIVKFVLFGQGKTGCSLLADLFSSHPQFQYDDEILQFNAFLPKLTVKAMCALSKKELYGIKIKLHQLTKHQRIHDPEQFMHELHRQGWKIIYLKRRNILRQSVDQLISLSRIRKYFSKDVPSKLDKTYIDSKELIEKVELREKYNVQEAEVLKSLPHITIVFEDDLFKAENHQRTLDKISVYMDLPSVPVKKIFIRESSKRFSDLVQNYEEVIRAISQTKYAKFLED